MAGFGLYANGVGPGDTRFLDSEDADVNSDVLLLNEDSSLISFSCAAPHRYLCLFLKSLDSFVTMEVRVNTHTARIHGHSHC